MVNRFFYKFLYSLFVIAYCCLTPIFALAHVEYSELERNVNVSTIRSKSLYLKYKLKGEPTTDIKTKLITEIMINELNNEYQNIHLTIYQESSSPTNENLLQKTATASAYSSCLRPTSKCQNPEDFHIRFLTNTDKSKLQQFDDIINKYKNLIIYLLPALIIGYLKIKKRKKA